MSCHELLGLSDWMGKIVEMTMMVEQDEIDVDPGMKAVVVEIFSYDDGVLSFTLDTRPFQDHNDPLMSSNYYDKKGIPRLTAKEAGCWEDVTEYYIDTHLLESRLKVVGTYMPSDITTRVKEGRTALSFWTSDQEFHLYKRKQAA